MRGIAILAVVIIHLTASATIYYPPGCLKYYFYNTVNSMVMFAVPLFLFISALIISKKLSNSKVNLREFYIKRCKGLIIPYVIWSSFYIGLRTVLNSSWQDLLVLNNWLNWFLHGSAFYHLYFFVIIFQLYLFLPLLCRIFKKFSAVNVFIVAFALQGLFYYLNKMFIYKLYPSTGSLLGSYLTVSIIGCWIGMNYEKILSRWQSKGKFLLILNILATVLYVSVNIKLRLGEPVGIYFYYGCYHAFVVLTSINLWLICVKKESGILTYLGENSFAIYLLHPFYLAVWNFICGEDRIFNQDITLLLGFIFVMFLSYTSSRIVSFNKNIKKILLAR